MPKPKHDTDAWRWETMWRGQFDLSVEQPVMSMHAVHNDLSVTGFDMHYEVEIGIVRRGRMLRRYLDWSTELSAGDVWLCGMWEPHGFHVLECPCELSLLVVSPEFLNSSAPHSVNWLAPFTAPPPARPAATPAMRPELRRIARRLIASESLDDSRGEGWRRTLLFELILLLTDGWDPAGRGTTAFGPGTYGRIQPAIRMVFESRQLITEQAAAHACAMSRNIFCKHFDKAMGISFARFALRHRLREAARQLLATDTPIKAVATDWGFADVSHLHRAFVRHYGCTPREYRIRSSTSTRG